MPAGTGAVLAMPTFSPSGAPCHGLELLASAASSVHPPASGPLTALSQPSSLLGPGTYNPAASLPAKLVKRILDLDFVEMSELVTDIDTTQQPGRSAPPPPTITTISQWAERFALMAAILTTRYPDKAPEFFGYLAIIIRAERNYEGDSWIVYDRQFRREALARRDLNWSVTDPRLYNEAFTGRARAIRRCGYCLRDDHSSQSCGRNPNRGLPGWPQEPQPWSTSQPTGGQEICRRF